jgi:hypothetical protein
LLILPRKLMTKEAIGSRRQQRPHHQPLFRTTKPQARLGFCPAVRCGFDDVPMCS